MSEPVGIPAKYRKLAYSAYAILGVAIGATQVAYSTANIEQPVWLSVVLAVFAFVGSSFGLTAFANVGAAPARAAQAAPEIDE